MFKDSHVTVIVSSLENALEFYVDTLGMQLKDRFENQWAEVETNGMTIGLHPAQPGTKPNATESMSIGLQVDDMDEAMVILRTKGVVFMPDVGEDFPKMAFFKDPDGNPLYLIQFDDALEK